MKVKTMKKALSVLCASAMVAGTFAVADMGTVEAAAPLATSTWSAQTYTDNGKQYIKVPYSDLVADADSYTTAEGSGRLDTKPAQFIDGDTTTYYHSKYSGGSGVGTDTNTSNNTANKLRLSFKDGKSCKVAGISYLPRQNASRPNGTFDKIQVTVKKGVETSFTPVDLKSGENANKSEVTLSYGSTNWGTNKNKESVILFDQPQEVKEIEIVVKQSQGNHMTAGEISVLTAAEYNEQGVYVDVADFSYTDGSRRAAPAPAGKVFEGWYSDSAYQTFLPKTTTQGQAYAKFVDAKLLNVKSQVPVTADSKKSTTLRFVCGLNTNKYKEAGFYLGRPGQTATKYPVSAVFKRLAVIGDDKTDMNLDPKEALGTQDANLFMALGISPLNTEALLKQEYTAQAYFVTVDGIEVKGDVVTRSVYQNLQSYYLGKLVTEADGSVNLAKNKEAGWQAFYDLKASNLLGKNAENWSEYANTSQYIFGKKLEISGADGNANKDLQYTFTGTGVVVFGQKCPGAGSATFVIDNDQSTEATVNFQSGFNDSIHKTHMYSIQGLDGTKTHTLTIKGVRGGVGLDALYVVK